MYKIITCLFLLFLGCTKNSENTLDLTKDIRKNNFDSLKIIFNNGYFYINLKSGEIEKNTKKIGKINIDIRDENIIIKSFYKNHIDTMIGEYHVFDEHNFTTINKDDIITVENNNINRAFFYINDKTQLKDIKSFHKKNILLFYMDIKSILGNNKVYRDLLDKNKNDDKSVDL